MWQHWKIWKRVGESGQFIKFNGKTDGEVWKYEKYGGEIEKFEINNGKIGGKLENLENMVVKNLKYIMEKKVGRWKRDRSI